MTKDLVPADEGPYIEYNSNNSGGRWWLTDDGWRNLAQAGWIVGWHAEMEHFIGSVDAEGRWLGTLASSARRYGVSLRVATAEWQDVTGQDPEATGCTCCGSPHSFCAYDAEDPGLF
jgi:hypothetical protein